MLAFFGFILVAIVALVVGNLKIVPQANAYIVERLGAYKCTLSVGMHFICPIIERIAKRVSLKEQVLDFPPQNTITKDNVTMQIDTVIYFQVTDPKMFSYAVENPILALENLTATTLRNVIGGLELDETLTSRDLINTSMQETLDEATDPWGIKVKRVEIKDIQPPRGILDSMEKQMKAERDRRETLLEAEGHKQSVVMRAEGDKQAKILEAEADRDAAIAHATGEAESIRLVYEAEAIGLQKLKEAKMDHAVLELKKLEALKTVANGRSTKMIIPTELASTVSNINLIGEAFKNGTESISDDEDIKDNSTNFYKDKNRKDLHLEVIDKTEQKNV